MNIRHTFAKSERLCSQKIITELFAKGSSGFIYPFRYTFTISDTNEEIDEPNLKLLISVSKRYHKRANKRNLNKRRIRESFRLNNHSIKSKLSQNGKSINLALVYCSKDCLEFKIIENAVKKIFSTLEEKL